MEVTKEPYRKIEKYLPKQRGNVKIENLQLINAVLYVLEKGCKWRPLPEKHGKWHTVYTRLNKEFEPVAPPERNRRNPWEYDKERCRQRNEIERFFLRLKCFPRIFYPL